MQPSDLEMGVAAVVVAGAAAAIFAGPILALGMASYAKSLNDEKIGSFLTKKLGVDCLEKVVYSSIRIDPNNCENKLIEFELDGNKYLMHLRHLKTSWLADFFYDTRIYTPVNIKLL
jgi:hypothetical protein